MTKLAVVLLLLMPLIGCRGIAIHSVGGGVEIGSVHRHTPSRRDIPTFQREYPTVNLPYALRQRNWIGDQHEGSCVHATMVSLFRWQGRYATANYWRRSYSNGEWAGNLAQKMDREGIRFAYTVGQGDVRFLEWACRTRRGCGVTVMGGRHMVALVHLDDQYAGILDNNDTTKIIRVPRETFIAEWINSNSWGIATVYSPVPPLPY